MAHRARTGKTLSQPTWVNLQAPMLLTMGAKAASGEPSRNCQSLQKDAGLPFAKGVLFAGMDKIGPAGLVPPSTDRDRQALRGSRPPDV